MRMRWSRCSSPSNPVFGGLFILAGRKNGDSLHYAAQMNSPLRFLQACAITRN